MLNDQYLMLLFTAVLYRLYPREVAVFACCSQSTVLFTQEEDDPNYDDSPKKCYMQKLFY